jgi:glycosyltransferase involved in cell wall biosynthesis
LILAHFTLPAGAVARHWSRTTGTPFAVVLHGSDVPGYQARRFGWLYPLLRGWCRSIWRSARAVTAVSPDLRELALRTWPEGRIAVVGNGVDTDHFRPDSATEPQRGLLLTVAQLIPRKGLNDLIEALASPRLAPCRLQIVGVGPAEPTLRRQVIDAGLQDRVEFLGLVEHVRLPALLRRAELFVLPSHREGLPLALLEAMACGRPVVATSVGGIPDLVQHGVNGWLVPPSQPAELADTLVRALGDRALLANCARAARLTAETFSWTRIWERYESVLR